MTANRQWPRWVAAAALTAALAGCGKDSPDALVDSARQYAAKGDFAAAAIQLKNALVQRPQDGGARRLPGEALLETRDPASAEKELRRALQLQQPEAAVAPLVARSLYEQREFDALLKEFAGRRFDAPEVEARVRTYVGEALLARRRPAEAAAAFAAALQAVPAFAPAQLGAARLALPEGRLDKAQRLAGEVIVTDAREVEAQLLAADVELARSDRAVAQASLKTAVEGEPADLLLYRALVSLARDASALDAAPGEADIDKEVDAFAVNQLAGQPRQAAVRIYVADCALRQWKLNAAAANANKVTEVEANNVVALNNMAWIGGELSDPKALGYAERAAKLAPESAAVLDTLGMLLVRRGQTERGLRYLEEARRRAPGTPRSAVELRARADRRRPQGGGAPRIAGTRRREGRDCGKTRRRRAAEDALRPRAHRFCAIQRGTRS